MPEQTWFDRLRVWLAEKLFRLGPALVDRAEASWGHDQSTFAPEVYGEYIATSVGVYTCATYRAANLARLPLRFYRVTAAGKREEVTSGELYELMQRVNPYWTLGRLLRMTELARCLWGAAYWVLERGANGRRVPREIWWARPDRMKVVPDSVNYLSGFVFENQGERIPFRPDEVVWLRMDNPVDEYSGLSPLAAARLSVDLGTAGLRSNARLFEHGIQIGGVISPADDTAYWTPEQTKQLEELFARRFKGVDKAHRWAVLSGGVKVQPLSLSPKDAEFIAQMKWSLNDIARVYHIPPELVGDHEFATYSNFDQAYKAFWSDCLQPEAQEIAEEITEQLLPLFGGQADLAEFDFSGVAALQEDRAEVVDQMTKLAGIGVPLNRLLEEFMPTLLPQDGSGYSWGNVWWAPATLLPAGSGEPAAPEQPEEPAERALRLVRELVAAQQRPALPAARRALEYGSAEHERVWKAFVRRTDSHERRFREAVEDLFRRQRDSVLARLRDTTRAAKALPEDDPFDKPQWIKRFKQEILPLFREIFRDVGEATLDELQAEVDFDLANPRAVRFLERRAQRFAREVNETTWQQLKEALKEGVQAGESIPQLAERVEEVMAGRIRSSAETIARTEVIGASNGGALEAARQSGVVKRKVWLAALDERTRETHVAAHGQTVGLDEDFEVGGGRGPAPGQIGLPEEDINCLPGDTLVLACGIERVYRRWYDGELVEITTACGHQLAATPNHPVLTNRGWIPLGLLQEGDDVICYGITEMLQSSGPDVEHVYAPISKVFDLATVIGTTERRRGSEKQFHGDGQQGDVDIVTLVGQLPGGSVATRAEPIENELLPSADLAERTLARGSLGMQPSLRARLAADSSMGRRGQSLTLVMAGASHASAHRGTTVARTDTHCQKTPANDCAGDPICVGQTELALAREVTAGDFGIGEVDLTVHDGPSLRAGVDAARSQVFAESAVIATEVFGNSRDRQSLSIQTDRIVNIRRRQWSGHVYNLQTRDAWYLANNIVTHNCRCTLVWEVE